MSWKNDLTLMLRSIIGDLDSEKYTDERLEQLLVVAAYATATDTPFLTDYEVSVGSVTINPDPIKNGDKNFSVLTVLRAACILIGSEVRTESSNAISIKDGPSAIDLRGVSQNLQVLYDKLCKQYEDFLYDYMVNHPNGADAAGIAVLSPYSPASMTMNAYSDVRGYEFY